MEDCSGYDELKNEDVESDVETPNTPADVNVNSMPPNQDFKDNGDLNASKTPNFEIDDTSREKQPSVSTSTCSNIRKFEVLVEKLPKIQKFVRRIEAQSCDEIGEKVCNVFNLEYAKPHVECKFWNEKFCEYVEYPDMFEFDNLPANLRFLVVNHDSFNEPSGDGTDPIDSYRTATEEPITYHSDLPQAKKYEEEEEEIFDKFIYPGPENEENEEKVGMDFLFRSRSLEGKSLSLGDRVIQDCEINVNLDDNRIEDELDDDFLINVRKLPKQKENRSTKTPNSEEEEIEGEQQEQQQFVNCDELDIPEEIVEGLKVSVTKPRDPLISKKTTICVLGRTSCGKSSLINYIMSGDMDYICPSGSGSTTRSISYHHYTENEIDISRLRNRLHNSNISKEGEEIKSLGSFRNQLWKNVIFVDTPGLCDYFETKGSGRCKSVHIREKLENCIKSSDIVLYLVDPRQLDSIDVHNFLSRVAELNTNIIVAVTKFDLMVRQIVEEQKRNFRLEEEENTLEREVIRIFNRLQEKFMNFGAPVVAVQVKEDGSTEGPHYFNTQYLVHVIRSHQNPKFGSMLELRTQVYEFMKNRRQVPIHQFKKYKDRVRSRRNKILTVGGASTAVLGSTAVGAVGLLGVGIGMGLLAIPGLGTSLGSAAITSGVAAIGGSLVSGLALIGGTIAFGSFSAIMGGLVGFGISNALGTWSLQLPPSGRVSMSFFHEEIGSIIGKVEVKEKKVWKKIIKYEKNSKISSSSTNARKKYFEDEVMDYFDSIVVKFEQRYYVIVARFINERLVTIVNIYEIGLESKKK